ncbi:MAG: hypothetical protein KDC66_22295 [Phaeodactylibacter sp.]|nr:hypothetical protein [Phaeodactylibacter sp.]MCB9272496.1 hypothetical protein [Lewinellaceae bacterium]
MRTTIASPAFWALLALLAPACGDNPKQPPAEETAATEPAVGSIAIDFSIEPGKRVGGIRADASESDVENLYGADQVQFRSVYIGEGESQPGVAVFPNTPNELEIVWDIAAATGKPEFIRASKEGTAWHTVQGVTVGTTLEELERINGGPFSIYGFGWDYGGLVTDWQGGKLRPYLIVALTPGKPELVGPEVSGDRAFSSGDPHIRAIEPRVGSMVITFER